MKVILILIFMQGYGPAPVTTTIQVEFSDKTSCEKARSYYLSEDFYYNIRARASVSAECFNVSSRKGT